MELRSLYIPTPKQDLAHRLNTRFKLFGGAMGGGKSRWLCEEVFDQCMRYPGNRAIIARFHLSDFKNSTLKTLLTEVLPAKLPYELNKSENRVTLPNGSEIIYMGLSEESDVNKLKSMAVGCFAFDEASEIPKEQFTLACTRLRHILPDKTRPAYHGILTSNPEDCWLKDTFVRGKGGEDYVFIASLPSENPYLPHDYKRNFKDMPEDWFKRYWEGNWDDLSMGDTVIPKEWIEACVGLELPRENKPVIGADIGRFGADESVAYFAMGHVVIDCDIKIKEDLTATTFNIMELEKRNQPALRICIDDIGLGGGVTDFLAHFGAAVDGINVGRRSDDMRFFNQKAQLWWNARELFRQRKVSIPADDKLIRQLGAVKFRYRATGKIIVEPKEDTKKRLGGSPDRADAMVLTLWAATGIANQASDFNRKPDIINIVQDSYGWEKFNTVTQPQNPEWQYYKDW